ncbi:helix-turn-helix domain-containing protein [bacterium LRH843]|nr:helix-turn-helix domain-containing protein [bacterium LRH843]
MNKITMSVKEVAAFLGVSVTTIYTMTRNNEIPYIKIRGRVLFNRDLIEEWTRGEHQSNEKEAVNN